MNIVSNGKEKMLALLMALFCSAVNFMCFAAADDIAADNFKVGYAKIDITPEMGTPISGYPSPRIADGVLDPLHARCVAMSDGANTAFVFSIDNLHLGEPIVSQIKESVSAKTKVPAEAIFLACTHTHTGPTYVVGWAKDPKARACTKAANEMLINRCAEVAAKAVADMAPSKILIGSETLTDISFIRRFKMKDGTYRTNPKRNDPNVVGPVGKPDETLQLVRFVRKGAKEIALVNFQCHPDVVKGNKFSADWPGLSCAYLEGAFGNDIHAIFINGAQGDTNHNRQRWKEGDFLPIRYEMAHHMARAVAGSAMKAWGFCREVPAGKVNAAVRMVKVRSNKAPAEDIPLAKKWRDLHLSGRGNEIPGKGMERITNLSWAFRVWRTRTWPDETELPVSVLTVGRSLAFGGFAGEPFTEMGREVKRRSKFAMTIPACCTSGSYGYFPTQDAFTVGGYENATSQYAKGTAERLVDGMIKQLDACYAAAE